MVFNSEPLGQEPYFNVPGYSEFRIDNYQHEIGAIDSKYAPSGATEKPSGCYWLLAYRQFRTKFFDKLILLGATLFQPITDHSEGKGNFVTAPVIDAFGKIPGIMTNKHYLENLELKNAK